MTAILFTIFAFCVVYCGESRLEIIMRHIGLFVCLFVCFFFFFFFFFCFFFFVLFFYRYKI